MGAGSKECRPSGFPVDGYIGKLRISIEKN
jgi:hypothetical protein